MKEEYDFSGGERGKFYHEAAEVVLPIYLEPDVAAFLQKVAIKKGVEVATVVNDWLRKDMAFIETCFQGGSLCTG
jgi:hypothetical protein